jgi:Carboxypeptidase regulatory-like domain
MYHRDRNPPLSLLTETRRVGAEVLMARAHAQIDGLVAGATESVLASLAEDGVTAYFGPPSDDEPGARGGALSVWPLDLVPEQVGVAAADLLRMRVRVLIAPDGSAAGLTALDRALVVAAKTPHLVLASQPVPTTTWVALRARPRAAVLVDVPVRVPRPAQPVVRVQGLRIEGGPTGRLRGHVLGPGERPVPDAVVRADGLGTSARTGRDGAFVLAGVPPAGAIRLVVEARGVSRSIRATGGTEPVVLRLDFEPNVGHVEEV